MNKQEQLFNLVRDNVRYDCSFCNSKENCCMYKHNEMCELFCEETGYDFKNEKAIRVGNCIRIFGGVKSIKIFGGVKV